MTTPTKVRYPLGLAEMVAERLVADLSDACERIEVAGSIRRRKAEVGDIELLVIPRTVEAGLFAGIGMRDLLDEAIQGLMARGMLSLRRSKVGVATYGPKNKLLVHMSTGIPVDVFTADARNFGMAMFVRTGPMEWNVKAMARFKQLGMRGHAYAGVTLQDGTEADCPEEADVFRLLGWEWAEPEARR